MIVFSTKTKKKHLIYKFDKTKYLFQVEKSDYVMKPVTTQKLFLEIKKSSSVQTTVYLTQQAHHFQSVDHIILAVDAFFNEIQTF